MTAMSWDRWQEIKREVRKWPPDVKRAVMELMSEVTRLKTNYVRNEAERLVKVDEIRRLRKVKND